MKSLIEWKRGGIYSKAVGLLCICHNGYALHLGVGKGFRIWGFQRDWFDGPVWEFGLGPFLLINWYAAASCR